MARKTLSIDSLAEHGKQIQAPAADSSRHVAVALSDEEVSRIRDGICEFLRELYFVRLRSPLLVDVLLGWAFEGGNVSKIAANMRIDRRNVQRLLEMLRGPETPETLRRVVGLPPSRHPKGPHFRMVKNSQG